MKLSRLVILSSSCLFLSFGVRAQSTIYLQDSSVSGFSKTINIGFLPVVTSSGTVYKDVTITLNVDASGNITYATKTPVVTLSPIVSPVAIQPGLYSQQGATTATEIQLNGPQPSATGGGVGEWTVTLPTSQKAGAPAPASFFTGPITGYPAALASRIKSAGINTGTYLGFGTIQNSGVCGYPCGNDWGSGTLFGIYTVGTQLIFDSFTFAGSDQKAPTSEISYLHN